MMVVSVRLLVLAIGISSGIAFSKELTCDDVERNPDLAAFMAIPNHVCQCRPDDVNADIRTAFELNLCLTYYDILELVEEDTCSLGLGLASGKGCAGKSFKKKGSKLPKPKLPQQVDPNRIPQKEGGPKDP